MGENQQYAVELDRVSPIYTRDEFEVRALDDIAIKLPTGRFVAIKEPSGSGTWIGDPPFQYQPRSRQSKVNLKLTSKRISMDAQPLIAVRNVPASSRWYQSILGCESGHGGKDYEQMVFEGRMVLQLHHWDAHEHLYLGNPDSMPYGNGVVLWFQTDKFNSAIERIQIHRAEVLEGPHVNTNANHREIWLRDLDGCVVVIASQYGDVGTV